MNHDSEKWLDDRISEDVSRMADKRIKELMESEELKDVEATMDELQSIRKRLGLINAEDEHDMETAEELTPEVSVVRNVEPVAAESEVTASDDAGKTAADASVEHPRTARRPRIRLRAALAAALVAILVLGVGIVGSGKKVYLPVVSQREDGDESTTVVDNNEGNVDSGFDEEEVCQEVEDELGVLPVRFGYQPKGMALEKFWITEEKEAVLKYSCGLGMMHIYISKDYDESSIHFKMDGILKETVQAEAMSMEIPVYEYEDSKGNVYMQSSFEYLNTYYSIDAMMDQEEFKRILENIIIKNV